MRFIPRYWRILGKLTSVSTCTEKFNVFVIISGSLNTDAIGKKGKDEDAPLPQY